MEKAYPLKLSPVFKEALWGGSRLKTDLNKKCPLEKLAESWELTIRENEVNTVENGVCKGMPLSAALPDLHMPLLVKLIDASDRLSIQVHPDDAYAREHERGDGGKTEAWYIVDAEPGARIVYGLRDGKQYNRKEFETAARSGQLEGMLNYINVKKGDLFFIPAGLVHAIGAGILVAEIQQSSDLTYRVYDYDRTDKNGARRELHLDKALDVIRPYTKDEIESLRFSKGRADENVLVNCDFFSVELIDGCRKLDAAHGAIDLLCISGDGSVDGVPFENGDDILLPERAESYKLCGSARVLAIRSNDN